MAATAMWDARHGLVGRFAQAGLLAVCLGWIASVLPLPWRDWVAVGLGIAVLCLLAGEPVALAGVALALTAYGAIEVLPRLRGGPVLALALGILVLGTSRLQAYHVPGTPWDVPAVIAAASGVALLRVVAYASDRSRGAPRLRLHEFLAAFFFFPTLPAGPIESPHAFVARRASSGGTPPPLAALAALARLVVGCAEFTLAPLLLLLLDTDVFASRGAAFGRLRLWLFVAEAGLLPTLLLDGWSNVAIALARLAGHDVPANVRAPWAAVDVADFWRRWHASFSRWLRDYVYGPLGGRRAAVRNVVLAFAVAAAWYVWGFVKLLGYQAYAPRAWRGLLVCAGANAAVVAVLYAFRLDRAPRAVAAAVRPVRSVATLAFVCLAFLPLVMPLSATFRDLAGVYLRLFGVR